MKFFLKNILLSFFGISFFGKADFIWMIHPLNMNDIYKRYGVLKFFPNNFINFLLKLIPPFVLSEVRGVNNFNGQRKRGYIMGFFLTPELMHNNKKMVDRKILKAAKITKLLESKILVIGGVISVSHEIEKRINSFYGISLSNGASTMTMVMGKRINDIIKQSGLQYNDLTLSIVNAASSKGSLVSNFFSRYTFKKVLLFDNDEDKLIALEGKIKKSVDISTDLNKLVNSDLIIIAPSYKKIKFEKHYFKSNAIIYDVNDPHYNFDGIINKINIYSNGLVNINSINYNYNLGIPEGMAYTCLAEAFLLAMANDTGLNYCNNVNLNEVDKISEYFNKSNLSLAK